MSQSLHRLLRTRIRIDHLAVLGLVLAPAVTPVMADDAVDLASAGVGDEVVVTGYRGETRTVDTSVVPIDVITGDTIQATGRVNLQEALEDLVPSLHVTASGSGTGRGVVSYSLRGLSSNETLVLVNGKRWHDSALVAPTEFGASPPDLSLIPIANIERVEVLRDGAAAQYGADAIAGVINVILKSSGTGNDLSALYGEYPPDRGGTDGRGATETLTAHKGIKLATGGTLDFGIDGSHNELSSDQGPLRNSYHIYPLLPNGQPDPRETSLTRYRYITGLPRETHVTAGVNFDQPLSDTVSFYFFGDGAYRKNFINGSYRAPTNLLDAAVVNLHPDGYMSALQIQETDYQVVAGVKGTHLLGWNWDLSISDAEDDAPLYTENTANPSFGPVSGTSFFNGRLLLKEQVADFDVTRTVDTGLVTAPLNVAAGLEYRNTNWQEGAGQYESYADGGYIIPSGPFRGDEPSPGSGFQAGYAPSQSGDFSRQNKSVYLDFDQMLTSKWDLSIAGRYEDYSTFGDAVSGKLSTRYDFNSFVALRGTVNNGFAAPTIAQQHYRYDQPQYNTNPDTGVVEKTGSDYVSVDDVIGRALGAQPLKPEKSLNYTAGIVFKPSDVSNVALDAYQIFIKDRIRISSEFDGTSNAVVRKILEDAGQDPNWQVYYFTNIGDTLTRGLDLTADYTSNFDNFGKVKWSLGSNQSSQAITRIAPTPAVLKNAGLTLVGRDAVGQLTEAYPKNTTTLAAAWTVQRYDLTLRATRYSQVDIPALQGPSRDETVDEATIIDLDTGYWVKSFLRASIGADNLFSKRPNAVSSTVLSYDGNFRSQPVYPEGSPYGYFGGFYYVRLEAHW